MDITLDGKLIESKNILYKTLKAQINSSEFYGNNLDALYDVLSSQQQVVTITIFNEEHLNNNLGEYSKDLINLFTDLNKKNENIALLII